MLRKLLIISGDEIFSGNIKMLSLMLTKLNYFIDLKIYPEIIEENLDNNCFIIIIDLNATEYEKNINVIRKNLKTKHCKIIGVFSSIDETIKRNAFNLGCDAVMEKSELLRVFDVIVR